MAWPREIGGNCRVRTLEKNCFISEKTREETLLLNGQVYFRVANIFYNCWVLRNVYNLSIFTMEFHFPRFLLSTILSMMRKNLRVDIMLTWVRVWSCWNLRSWNDWREFDSWSFCRIKYCRMKVKNPVVDTWILMIAKQIRLTVEINKWCIFVVVCWTICYIWNY